MEMEVVKDYDGNRSRSFSFGERRTCWVCFATDEDEPEAKWIQPCKCSGTTQWVHLYCLQRWIDEKQAGNPTKKVFCPQCNNEYLIRYPPLGPILCVIDYSDKLINKLSPIAAAGVVVGSLYWSAVSYGALTTMQVFGHKESIEMMEKADPLFLLVALPTIPLGLVLCKMIKWEDYILQAWRSLSSRIEYLKSIVGIEEEYSTNDRVPVEPSNALDVISTSRLLCGALMLPTFATAFGNYFFKNVQNPLKRTVLGGICFTLFKGTVKVYYRQQQYIRLAARYIAEPSSKKSSSL